MQVRAPRMIPSILAVGKVRSSAFRRKFVSRISANYELPPEGRTTNILFLHSLCVGGIWDRRRLPDGATIQIENVLPRAGRDDPCGQILELSSFRGNYCRTAS